MLRNRTDLRRMLIQCSTSNAIHTVLQNKLRNLELEELA